MRTRRASSHARRELLVRGLVYGTLAILVFAMAAYGQSPRHVLIVRDIAYVEGKPIIVSGYGLVVGLNGTGDGSQIPHTNTTLEATFRHLGIDTHGQEITTRNVAAVLVQAELLPGTNVGLHAAARVTALGDATDLGGGQLLPVAVTSRDGRFREFASGAISPDRNSPKHSAPASASIDQAVTFSQSVFMTNVPECDFTIGVRGLQPGQVQALAQRINCEFGEIAFAHSGCDIEIKLPGSYSDVNECASLVLQIAAMPVEDVIPALLVDRQAYLDAQE